MTKERTYYDKKGFIKVLHKDVVEALNKNGFEITEIYTEDDTIEGSSSTTVYLEYNRYEFKISYTEPGTSFKYELEEFLDILEDEIESFKEEKGFNEEIIVDLKNVLDNI